MGKFLLAAIGLLIASCGMESQSKSEHNEEKNDSIVLIGDSIFTTGNNRIEYYIETKANIQIDGRAVSGARMNDIYGQYQGAREQGFNTVIMDGGGNDVLGNRGNCQNTFNDNCKKTIDDAINQMGELWNQMLADGVEKVYFLTCHYPVGWSAGFNQAVDYGYEAVTNLCANADIECHVSDPRAAFAERNDVLIWDGVHPTDKGSEIMADLIMEKMYPTP